MLHHWLPSQEGFNINWQHIFRTFPNNKKSIFHNATKLKSKSKCGENLTNCFFEVWNLLYYDQFLLWIHYFLRFLCFHKSSIWHTRPGCVPSFHGCGWPFYLVCVFWIYLNISNIHFFNRSSFSQLRTFFVFLGFLSLNTCSWVTLILVVTLTSTTFTFEVIVYVSTTCWTSITTTYFSRNIFCISTNFGQFFILCPFKPQMWHAYEDVFCGFWFGRVAPMVAIVVFFFLKI